MTDPDDSAASASISAKAKTAGVEELVAIRRRHLVDAGQPMVLIAQPARSGGSLMAQLLDGHPELHSHPPELLIGPRVWPSLDPSQGPRAAFRQLHERHLGRAFVEGYFKDKPARRLGLDDQTESFPFLLLYSIQVELFLEAWARRRPASQRDVLDCYFTSLFNAWLDNQNLYGAAKRWIVAFRGNLCTPPNLAAFFKDYPDGRLIVVLREPKSHYASVRRFRDLKPGLEPIALWLDYAADLQDTLDRYGDRVFLLGFEQLVPQPQAVMRRLAEWLGIAFDPILVRPTFNRMPIKANSSFAVTGHGVRSEVVDNWRQELTPEEAAAMESATAPVYRRLRERFSLPPAAAAE